MLVHRVLIHNPGEFVAHVATRLHLSPTFLNEKMPSSSGGQQAVSVFMRQIQDQVVSQLLHGLTGVAFTALAIAAAVSVGLGWLIAGRMLRPLKEIAVVAKRASVSTLHERIALQGPKDELRELADTFDAMLARLEAAFAAQREFVANASHELRTPLAIIRTELDVTLADPEAETGELRRMAETIRAAVARNQDVVDKLLVLAESEHLAERGPVDLGAVVNDAVRAHARAGAQRGLSFETTIEPRPVEGDRDLLERLVDNLVDNAVRYATPDTVVDIIVAERADGVTLSVANACEAISKDELPHLLERFYRRGTARSRRDGGAGLGMAIVAAVATVHGGSVQVEGPPGGGLVVTVTLPPARISALRVAP